MATIVTKNSSTASAVPTTSDLVQGELAVNVTDKRIYTENASTAIVELGTNPSSITTPTATVTGTLTANGTFNSSNAVVTGGSVNGVIIGASSPLAITGSVITASTGFTGNVTGAVTGNVTGNLTGNVTGNVTGDLAGNVTATSGTTTLNNLALTGTVDFNAARLTDIGTPTASTDAVTKAYADGLITSLIDGAPAALDTLNELAAALDDDAAFHTTVTNSIAAKLPLAGGTLSGQLSLGANKIVSVADPTLAQDAATKAYVDSSASSGLPTAGGTMSGAIAMGTNKITGMGDPTAAQDASTKAYTDSILGSATSAATSASNASTSESNAATSASNASTSEGNASTSAAASANSAAAAATSLDEFDDRYLGSKSSDPTVDNDGNALVAGALYFNTGSDTMKVYTGSAWGNVAPTATSVTLSQVTDFPTQSGQTGKYLTTNGSVPSWATLVTDPTLGTLTQTFTNGQVSTISLTSSVLAPVVTVTKEVSQAGSTNNTWDVNSTSQNYTRLDSAPATTLSWAAGDVSTSTTLANQAIGNGSSPVAVVFNLTGTKMYVTDYGDKAIYSYTLSTAWDITTKSSILNSFNLAGQSGNPHGMCFNSDGTIIFTAGYTANVVYKYICSTAFDITTASYSQTLTGMSGPTGVQVNSTGTKLYVSNNGVPDVKEWDLSTAYDLSTASYNSAKINITNPRSMAFTSNGAKFYIVTYGGDVNEYSLSTGFSLSTASLVASYDASAQDSNLRGLAFKSDFSQMFLAGATNDKVYSYNFSDNLTLGTGSFAAGDVGKTIEANSGVFVLTATSGSYVETTAPTSYAQVASGSWEMYGTVYNTTDGDLELSSYKAGFNISTAVFATQFSVTAQDTSPRDVTFNTDGTKMFVTGTAGVDINEYTLSVAFDLSSTVTFVDRKSLSGQDNDIRAVKFNSDGTKMFMLGAQGNAVYAYTLTTAFTVSTVNAYIGFFNVGSQESDPKGLAFSSDGTKMFVSGNTGDDVNEYSLSTGFDISTASFVDSFSFGSEDTNPNGLTFSADGTKMFNVGGQNDSVYRYNLTAWDVSTAVYDSAFSVAGYTATPWGVAIDTDGNKMFVVNQGGTVQQYTLPSTFVSPSGYNPVHTTTSTDTTYWTDINSMTANQAAGSGNIYYAISTDDRTTWSVIKNGEGERNIVRNNGGTWQYNTAVAVTGGALSQATFDSTGTISQSAFGAFWADSGNLLFIPNDSNDTIYKYTVSSAYDISTASESQSFSVSAQESVPTGIFVRADGLRFYVSGQGSSKVHEYTMSTAYDLSTASFTGSTGTTTPNLTSCWFKEDGLKMYTINYSNSSITYWTLSTAWDITSASYVSATTLPTKTAGCNDLSFNSAGTQLYVDDNTDDKIYKYTLSTAWDVTSVSYAEDFSHATQLNQVLGMIFNSDLTEMILFGGANWYKYSTSIESYTTSETWANATTNTELDSIAQSMSVTINKMDKTQLDAVTDPNHIALSNDLDLAIVLNLTSGTTVPSSNGVSINYDANVLNKAAVLGTDYDYDAPAQNKVRFTALAANNLKIRVL